eukprot:752761_1
MASCRLYVVFITFMYCMVASVVVKVTVISDPAPTLYKLEMDGEEVCKFNTLIMAYRLRPQNPGVPGKISGTLMLPDQHTHSALNIENAVKKQVSPRFCYDWIKCDTLDQMKANNNVGNRFKKIKKVSGCKETEDEGFPREQGNRVDIPPQAFGAPHHVSKEGMPVTQQHALEVNDVAAEVSRSLEFDPAVLQRIKELEASQKASSQVKARQDYYDMDGLQYSEAAEPAIYQNGEDYLYGHHRGFDDFDLLLLCVMMMMMVVIVCCGGIICLMGYAIAFDRIKIQKANKRTEVFVNDIENIH